MVPPSASSNRPRRLWVAPVKAPFSWPNSSDAINAGGIAAQFTRTNARPERRDSLWMARATSSLPVPVSPLMRTVESVGATLVTCDNTRLSASEEPMISSNIDRSEEHTSELQSPCNLVCRLLLEKKKKKVRLKISSNRQRDK